MQLLPDWVTPDQLTLLAFLSAVGGFCFYIFAFQNLNLLWFVNICLVVHWFADGLDGNLARYRNRQRPNYGYYIDHALDTATAVLFLGGLEASALTSSSAWGWVLAFMLLSMVHVFLKTKVTGEFHFSIQKVGPTEARLLLIFVNTIIIFIGNPQFIFSNFTKLLPATIENQIYLNGGYAVVPLTLFDILGWIAVGALMWTLIPEIIKTAVMLDKRDRSNWHEKLSN